MQISGAPASSLPKCNFFDQMSFLHDKTINVPSESNVSIPLNEIAFTKETAPVQPNESFYIEPETPIASTALSSPSSNTNFEIPAAKRPREKRKRSDDVTGQTSQILEQIGCRMELRKNQDDENEDSLFCRSLKPTLKKLPPKKNKLAKIKISQLLFELEFDGRHSALFSSLHF